MGIFKVVKNKDYTVINNYLCKDRRLSLKGKGLLTVMLSLPEDWDYTIRGLSAILLEGERAIGTTLKELEALGYLERHILRNRKGIITDTEYIIYEQPFNDMESGRNAVKSEKKPQADLPLVDSADVDTSHADNSGQLNTKELSTKEYNQSSVDEDETMPVTYEDIHDRINDNIEYDNLMLTNPKDKDVVDEIVGVMADVINQETDTVRINRQQIAFRQVRERFLQIRRKHMEYILKSIKKSRTDITNIRSYIITCVYNAATTVSTYSLKENNDTGGMLNRFNSFKQRTYDFAELERRLICNV